MAASCQQPRRGAGARGGGVVVAWVVVAVALGTIISANVLAIDPALLAARVRPASLLKAE
jgi:hypothetical protein